MDDSWPIKAGMFVHILPIFDPENLFEKVKKLPQQVSDEDIRNTMQLLMIWEPYETMGKTRNNYRINNLNYLSLGSKRSRLADGQTHRAGQQNVLQNQARTFEESLLMKSTPYVYEELVKKVMEGQLDDKEQVYQWCKNLWEGLNSWFDELGIDYKSKDLPF